MILLALSAAALTSPACRDGTERVTIAEMALPSKPLCPSLIAKICSGPKKAKRCTTQNEVCWYGVENDKCLPPVSYIKYCEATGDLIPASAICKEEDSPQAR